MNEIQSTSDEQIELLAVNSDEFEPQSSVHDAVVPLEV